MFADLICKNYSNPSQCDPPIQVITTIPTAFLFLFSPILIYTLSTSHKNQIRNLSPIHFRVVIGYLLVITQALTVAYGWPTDSKGLVKLGGISLALILTILCKKRGIITSGVLTIYWFLVITLGISELWYYSSGHLYFWKSTLYVTAYGLSVFEFILCCFVDSQKDRKLKKASPEQFSSFINQITFHWFSKLVHLGNKKELEFEDLWDLNEEDKAENVIPKCSKNWSSGVSKSIIFPLFKTHKLQILAGSFYKLTADMLLFLAPQLLKQLINFIENLHQPLWIGVSIVFSMFLTSLFQSMLFYQYYHTMYRVGMHIRSSLTSAVYSKTLKLSNEARKVKTTGEIVNLMSVDVEKLQDVFLVMLFFVSAPIQVLLSIFFLWNLLGAAALAGFLTLLLIIPINAILVGQMRNYQTQQMKHKDERIKLMSEILNGIKVLKLYSWEKSMEKMVLNIREKELRVLKKISYLNSTLAFLAALAPLLVSAISFLTYVYLNPEANKLTPEITFVALSLFDILRSPLNQITMAYEQAVQCVVSNKRLKQFFSAEEISESKRSGSSGFAVKIENGRFSWNSGNEGFTLSDINLEVKPGELVAVVGRVGSGKSSLLQAILGEMNNTTGTVLINGSISYVPQQAWIQNMSLKNNILFNTPPDFTRYDQAVSSCALKQDLLSLPAEDETKIGEKGINLSGGQKQRVSIARAVYQNHDVVLLDDPLSAVDAHAGRHIFDNVISSQTGCLRSKTRILVTHNLTYLKHCDRVIVMKNGEISEMGKYQELISSEGEFAELLKGYLGEEDKDKHHGDDTQKIVSGQMNPETQLTRPPTTSKETDTLLKESSNKPEPKLIEKEVLGSGSVKISVYKKYLHAIRIPISLLFLSVFFFSSTLGVFSNFYLAELSDRANLMGEESNNMTSQLMIYTGLGIGQAILICLSSITLTLGMVRASKVLHEGLLKNIMRSPMVFFDVTPIGRIFNRVGKDIEAIDRTLPDIFRQLVMTVFNALSTVVVIIWATPLVGIAFALLSIGYFFILTYFVNTSRQLKRMESSLRSPIYSHFQESIQGATSIRAYGIVDQFIKQSQQKVDDHLKAHYPSIVANRWLAVRLELIGNLIVVSTAGSAVYFRDSPGLSAGLVGLSVSYALTITQTLNWAVRMTGQLEANIVSVERIQEYSNTPTESNYHSKSSIPSENWPNKGGISIRNLSVRYRCGLDLVLKNLSMDIKSGEKIGIVGRTGAGKSSLSLALFRIIEADEGSIEIDGINIADVGLETLRSRLTIVPQDPVLFSGSLRMNLDPFNVYSDCKLWEVLENSHLGEFVRALSGGLDHHVSEGGENLSVGQRQLICLARALLRKSKVLILDEAAAAVDFETDSLIQKTIQEQFEKCTVLTIAHRLNTVLDSDRIIVLENGSVAEFDTPKNLLANSDGIFRLMAKNANVFC